MTQGALTYHQEPLAQAIAIRRLRGASGPAWIATRIAELALAGDLAGVRRLRRIAAQYQRLLSAGLQ